MHQIDKPITIVGISLVTSNAEAFVDNTIGKLWEDFFKNAIQEKIPHASSASVFSVYSDYESDYQGKYRITLGCQVDQDSSVPAGLTKVTIPVGKYKVVEADSAAPEDIVAAWKSIWAIDPAEFQPNFVTMFEEYSTTNAPKIYVSFN